MHRVIRVVPSTQDTVPSTENTPLFSQEGGGGEPDNLCFVNIFTMLSNPEHKNTHIAWNSGKSVIPKSSRKQKAQSLMQREKGRGKIQTFGTWQFELNTMRNLRIKCMKGIIKDMQINRRWDKRLPKVSYQIQKNSCSERLN